MGGSKVTILSKEDLEKRYSGERAYTYAADEVRKILNMEIKYQIVLIENDAFFGGIGGEMKILFHCKDSLKAAFPDYSHVKLVKIIDKSELSKNRVYVSCILTK